MVEDMTDLIEHRMLTYEQQKCLQTYRSEFFEMYSKVDDDFSIQTRAFSWNWTPVQKSKRIDLIIWLFKSCRKFDVEDMNVYFNSIHLMDIYQQSLAEEGYSASNKEDQLVASTCMFISSKLLEIDSIHIRQVIQYLMGNKVDRDEIVDLEEKIIEKAEWDIV